MSADTRRMMQPALIGGVALGVASQIPLLNLLNCACCILVIGGGLLAAFLFFREEPPQAQTPYGDGAILGLLTGVIGAIVGTIVSIPVQLALGAMGMGHMKQIEEALRNADLPPAATGLLSGLMGGGLSIASIIIGFFFSLVIDSLFAMIGGLIGAAVFARKS